MIVRIPASLCVSPRRSIKRGIFHHHKIVGRSNGTCPYTNLYGYRTFTRSSSCSTLLEEYNKLAVQNKLLFDADQERVVKKFTRLQQTMNEYDQTLFLQQLKALEEYEEARQRKNQQQNTDGIDESEKQTKASLPPPSISVQLPRGIYLYGDVGTGKSMIMNMFFNSSPFKKRRLHFHSLLQEIHSRIFELNKQILQKHGRSFHVDTSKNRNPIIQIAQQLSTEVALLCIDEFQVTDVADAMILSQLFGELWRHGVVVVATSNRPPHDLYEDGLNRSYFLPFIDLLEKHCLVLQLGACSDDLRRQNIEESIDYRRIKSGIDESGSYRRHGDYYFLTSAGSESTRILDDFFDNIKHSSRKKRAMIEQLDPKAQSKPVDTGTHLTLEVPFRRNITISRYHSNVIARFSFEELCMTELGSSDYQAIANNFQIIMIESIPQLTLKHPDRARRFITLIDELYESGCCLICSAEEIPDNLFVGKVDLKSNRVVDTPTESSQTGDLLAVDVAQSQGVALSKLASIKELSYAFRRAASRLIEMCSNTWWSEKGVVF